MSTTTHDATAHPTGERRTGDERRQDAPAVPESTAEAASRQDSDAHWYKDAIIYQAHVKAFGDSNGDGIGDFRGLTGRLDYIQSLGVTAVWLLPFYPSPQRDDGYDIAEYQAVHENYGTMEDAREFIREAHGRGLRVITELIINHTSDQHPWFQAARHAPKGSPERDFYVWSDDDAKFEAARIIFTDTEVSNWTWDPVAKQYFWHRFFSHQPDLNFDNPKVLQAVLDIMYHWLDLGVDGLRLDAIPYLIEREGTSCENLPETHDVLKKIRAALDAKYPDRMLLAEANQWPEDVREYFADGDECHMAYHFPVMPRMYMAVAQEDRYPIIDIMAQTPDIPANCQWAIFLRNHDELTLEMVTDTERDYMYRQYAADPRMRVNVGIRRRLAPLLENDGDRIRLMNGLLLSLLGTPVMYYGDEIGMGDNIYLGDRNGVRTPMQWSPDRNAGFSRADPQRLYLPPIMDATYGYEAVNVESQERSPASLLNWMKRMIAVRKRHLAFGRGTLRFLSPGNRKILAYLREYTDETGHKDVILCVVNLSRNPQPVELDLGEFEGVVPVELSGRTAFPPIGKLPYLLTLPGHGFYWFGLAETASEPSWHNDALAPSALPVLVMASDWESFFADESQSGNRRESAGRLNDQLVKRIGEFLPTQRWFAAKGERIERVSVERLHVFERGEDRWLLCWVEAALGSGDVQHYFLPLAIAWDAEGEALMSSVGANMLARVRRQARVGVLFDAFADSDFCRALAGAMRSNLSVDVPGGKLAFAATGAFDSLLRLEGRGGAEGGGGGEGDRDGQAVVDALDVTTPSAQGSNSAVVLERSDVHVDESGDPCRLFLKAYRRLRGGTNPELEIGRQLTDVAGFEHAAPLAGSIEFVPDDAGATPAHAIAILQGFARNQGDLWSWTTDYLERYVDGVLAVGGDGFAPTPVTVEEGGDAADDPHGAIVPLMRTLGRRTGQMHGALIRPGDDTFSAEPATRQDVETWTDETTAAIDESLERLRGALDSLPAAVRERAEVLLGSRDALAGAVSEARTALLGDGAGAVPAATIRHHGDYHLGQVLIDRDDVVIIDFEGEPDRSIDERRRRHTPLKDVAGMLRSFDYAAATALQRGLDFRSEAGDAFRAGLDGWRARVDEAFLAGWHEGVEGVDAALWPERGGEALLDLMTIDKALYELRYEISHRPGWTSVPVEGLLRLIDA